MDIEGSLIEHFSDLPDPRMVKKCDHLLVDIVMIAICATIANADGWDDIAFFAEGKKEWLKQWLALPNGIPSHDTFKRVFEHLDAQAFQERFMGWVQAVFQLTAGQVIAMDGKTLRGTCDKQGKSTLHVVSAWASANRVTLAQVKVGEKANEIVAIPRIVGSFDTQRLYRDLGCDGLPKKHCPAHSGARSRLCDYGEGQPSSTASASQSGFRHCR